MHSIANHKQEVLFGTVQEIWDAVMEPAKNGLTGTSVTDNRILMHGDPPEHWVPLASFNELKERLVSALSVLNDAADAIMTIRLDTAIGSIQKDAILEVVVYIDRFLKAANGGLGNERL